MILEKIKKEKEQYCADSCNQLEFDMKNGVRYFYDLAKFRAFMKNDIVNIDEGMHGYSYPRWHECNEVFNLDFSAKNGRDYLNYQIKKFTQNQSELREINQAKQKSIDDFKKNIKDVIIETIDKTENLIIPKQPIDPIEHISNVNSEKIYTTVMSEVEKLNLQTTKIHSMFDYARVKKEHTTNYSSEKNYEIVSYKEYDFEDDTIQTIIKRELAKLIPQLIKEVADYNKGQEQIKLLEGFYPQYKEEYTLATSDNPCNLHIINYSFDFAHQVLQNSNLPFSRVSNHIGFFTLIHESNDAIIKGVQIGFENTIKKFNEDTNLLILSKNIESNTVGFVKEHLDLEDNPYKKYGYNLCYKECSDYILDTSKERLPIERFSFFLGENAICGDDRDLIVFDPNNEDHKQIVLNSIDSYKEEKLQEFKTKYYQSKDPAIVKEREEKLQQKLENDLQCHFLKDILDRFNADSKELSFSDFTYIKDLLENSYYKNAILNVLIKKENTKLYQLLSIFEAMYKRYKQPRTIVSSEYQDGQKHGNCLIHNLSVYSNEFLYASTFYGAQVYRKNGKLILKLSHKAQPEKLKSSQIQERLSETYPFYNMDNIDDEKDCFNVNTTVNVTTEVYSPYTNAEFFKNLDTLEIAKNTCDYPTIKEAEGNDFSTIEHALEILFKGDKNAIEKHNQILALHLQKKAHPNFQVVHVTDNSIGSALDQFYNTVLSIVYNPSNYTEIDGIELYTKIKKDTTEYLIKIINELPVALNLSQKRAINKNLVHIEATLNTYTLPIIKTTDVTPLNLFNNADNYCLFNVESDFGKSNYLGFNNSTKMIQALKSEAFAYRNYLLKREVPETIEVIDNNFTKKLQSAHNRVSVHAEAWLSKDDSFFTALELCSEQKDRELLQQVKMHMSHKRPRVSQQLAIDVFITMENTSASRSEIIEAFRAELPDFFTKDKSNNTKQENSDEYYWIHSPYNPYYDGTDYDKNVKIK